MAATTLESIQPYVEQLFDDSDVQKHLARATANLRGAQVARGQRQVEEEGAPGPDAAAASGRRAPQAAVAAGVAIKKGPEKQAPAQPPRLARSLIAASAPARSWRPTRTRARSCSSLIGQSERDAGKHMTDARETDMACAGTRQRARATPRRPSWSRQLSEQTSRLVQQEMELAKAELSEKGKQAGIGAGLFGGAGVFGLYALGALDGGGHRRAEPRDGHLAGRADRDRRLGRGRGRRWRSSARAACRRAPPPIPEQSVESVKEDVQWTKTSAQRGRR